MLKRNRHLVPSALPVSQEPNASGDKVYMRRPEDSPILCSNCGQTGHNKRTCSAKTKDKALPIKQSNNINIEEAMDELLCLQEENEEDDYATKDERSTTGKTESLPMP